MLGDIENLENKPSDNRGMTPRVFEYLFARIRRVIIYLFMDLLFALHLFLLFHVTYIHMEEVQQL
jgi:hypothetical protein